MYVCDIHMCVRTRVHTNMTMHIDSYLCISHTCVFLYNKRISIKLMNACIHTFIYICTYTYIYQYKFKCIYISVRLHMCRERGRVRGGIKKLSRAIILRRLYLHIYKYIYTHTHTHKYIYLVYKYIPTDLHMYV